MAGDEDSRTLRNGTTSTRTHPVCYGSCLRSADAKQTSAERIGMSAECQKRTSSLFESAVACWVKREPHVPLTGPQGDDEKYAPCLLYPPLAQRYRLRVGGCHHRSSRIRPRRSARAQAIAAADCASLLPPYPWGRSRRCTTKPQGFRKGAAGDCP